ncbi:TadE-like protein [Bifidobacterium sp. DSM 109958]|uniref:TadE-like protein n=1 Tax=Bifidobacterium moraviense TaxID=2675323 RepID=A0A7Y0HZN8_9BIFI|nr:Rv3654c family TadE-like protein [Bifidobacterium sp. DSM 109958]NMN00578.1 TadE-like protein [Bifidobacterium sp. DSM 109958]
MTWRRGVRACAHRLPRRIGRGLRRADRGSGTVLGAALIMVAAVLLCIVAAVGQVMACRLRAQGAADVAALAVASARYEGRDGPCAEAERIVAAHGFRLDGCLLDGADAQVTVSADTGVPLAGAVTARARAGPTPCVPSERDGGA